LSGPTSKNNYQKPSAKSPVRYVFGPVPSRRLGLSLGIDLVRQKTCSFDCVYCQLGPTTNKTVARAEYVSSTQVLRELDSILREEPEVDYVTLSGSGEPTLNIKMGSVLAGIRERTDLPIAVLTNSSLLDLSEVRRELALADVVIPSLDAAREESFRAINRPHPSLRLDSIVRGLVDFAHTYSGRIWLETMLVKGFNDGEEDVDALSQTISRIKPEKVQLNTVVRPPAESYAHRVPEGRLKEIAGRLGAEIISEFSDRRETDVRAAKERIVDIVSRHPCTVEELMSVLGIERDDAMKNVKRLERKGVIRIEKVGGRDFLVMTRKDA